VATMEKMKVVLGDNHHWALENVANPASTYRNQGRLKNAEALGVKVIEMKQVNGDYHLHTLRTMENLADRRNAPDFFQLTSTLIIGNCVLVMRHII